VRLLEETLEEKFHDIDFGNNVEAMTAKAQATQTKTVL
jgi:hypothetical protein